jgi:oxygen-independent coproporphyrinogen-3 oxidase
MSTLTTTTTTGKGEHHATQAGNYFVANYPPFSFWKPSYVPDALAALDRPAAPGTVLGLYVHIPFCRKRCHFCYFKVYTDQNAAQVQRYIDTAIAELDIYARKPFVNGRKPEFIYFGGGTPSYLSARQLKDLTDRLKDSLPWTEAKEVAFECEPGTLTEPKLEAIREMGVTRLSLGIENFDDHILEINGRAHRSGEIDRAYNFARSIGFDQINIDLISGMVEETESNWKKCVEKAVAMSPDSVTIYQMEIPYNTTIYKEMKSAGKLVAPVADWETKRDWVDYAFAEFEKAGYAVASAYTVVKDPNRTKFLYRDRLWEGADLIGVGVASFGHIGGVHFQNEHDVGPYMEKIDRGDLPIYRGMVPNDGERLIREMVLQMKLGHISRAYFQKKFGVDVGERFGPQLKHLEAEGFLNVKGDTIQYTRAGLLQVDRLLHDFFLPEHRDARYA